MQFPGKVLFYMTMHMEIRPIHSGRNIIELPKKTRHFSYKVY